MIEDIMAFPNCYGDERHYIIEGQRAFVFYLSTYVSNRSLTLFTFHLVVKFSILMVVPRSNMRAIFTALCLLPVSISFIKCDWSI